jgi:hypothetical protein
MNQQTFRVDLSFYSADVLDSAIADFAEVARIRRNGDELTVETDNDPVHIFDELVNYALPLIES